MIRLASPPPLAAARPPINLTPRDLRPELFRRHTIAEEDRIEECFPHCRRAAGATTRAAVSVRRVAPDLCRRVEEQRPGLAAAVPAPLRPDRVATVPSLARTGDPVMKRVAIYSRVSTLVCVP